MTYRVVKVDPVGNKSVARIIERMHRVCFPDMDQIVQTTHGDWWLARNDHGLPVAFAGLWPSARIDGAGYLCRAGVLPIARGQGLQRRLISAREREAKKKRWTVLFTDALVENAHSQNNIVAAGYRMFRPTTPWSGESHIYFRKFLEEGVA